jgi:hypothetical protein
MSALKKTVGKIDLGFVSIELIKPHIVCITTLTEEVVSVENGIKIIEEIKGLVGNTPHATILNFGDLFSPSKEFFKFIVSQRSPEKDNIVARGIVSGNLARRIEAQNFINFFKPLTPTKLFSTIDEAIAWIEPQLDKEN